MSEDNKTNVTVNSCYGWLGFWLMVGLVSLDFPRDRSDYELCMNSFKYAEMFKWNTEEDIQNFNKQCKQQEKDN